MPSCYKSRTDENDANFSTPSPMQRDSFAFWLLYGTPAQPPTEDGSIFQVSSKAVPSLETMLEQRFGQRFEFYGGDDVLEPIPLNDIINSNLIVSTPPFVDWDGPDDPENPHNWSVAYRWVVTLLSSLTTINV